MELASKNDWNVALAEFTHWKFQPNGNYEIDCANGRRLAREYLALNFEPSFAPALGWIVQSLTKLERPLSGLEIGFFHELNSRLTALPSEQFRPDLRVIDGGKRTDN